MADCIIRNATLVNEGRLFEGDLLIAGDCIAGIAPHNTESATHALPVSEGCEEVDATGCYLLPGVIDTHVHFRDGGDGSNPAGDFDSESRAARAGGVTSVVDMPNTQPPTVSMEALEAKERRAEATSAVNFGFMLGATNDNIDWLLSVDPARYAAVKLFLGSSTGNMLVDDEAVLDKLFERSRKLIVAHCESEPIVRSNMASLRAEFGGTAGETAALHPKVRNTEACFVASYQAVERARRHRTRLHIAHLSTATELSLLSNFPLEHKHITAEVSPNHLWFDDRDYAGLGNRIKCNPSIKSNDDRMALWAALEDGLIDTIATDHAPHPLEAKLKPYFDAPSGIPSIQHSLQMMLEALMNDAGRMSADRDSMTAHWLPLIVEKMCHNPARLFGIRHRGFLRQGYHADLVLVRPCPAGETVRRDTLRYKCGWSPLEGMTFHSRIERVWVNGDDSGAPSAARRLEFERFRQAE
ncbi:MAG: dihydroorotase [bacterium P3]|nr:MAG: dihydroorotase [bacterium P3]KWW41945.1 MAG: dihydroorotase [bacterium F083]